MHDSTAMDRIQSLREQIPRFFKAQCSALIASGTDYAVTGLLLGFTLLPYACSTFFGCLSGGICNCMINYKWVFQIHHGSKTKIGLRYFLVWTASLLLNTGGTCLLAQLWCQAPFLGLLSHSPEQIYLISRILISVCCAVFWNYPMQRFFVYKLKRQIKPTQNS